MKTLNKYIDHTLLKPTASEDDIRLLCGEALVHDFATVCIHPIHLKLAKSILDTSGVGLCTVVGFPLGTNFSSTKAFESRLSLDFGATEIDMVMDIGAAKEGLWKEVEDDIHTVVEAASGRTVKVILETCLLNDEEIIKACQCALSAGAHFVKTSTGFSTGGATAHAVALMKKTVGDSMEVKASGGIRDKESAQKMIDAGATRLGTSSSLAIIGAAVSKDSGQY